jgi:Glyoxalase/Bleomycin resistance protein/Dioxygenase superfamily
MTSAYLEHANLTVPRIEPVLDFLLTALPEWRGRGGDTMDWYGRRIRWLHVGSDTHYLALQEGGEGEFAHWQSHQSGVKHLGLVVDDLDAVMGRLDVAGYAMDHPGSPHPHRRSAYYGIDGFVQIEFVQYLSIVAAERNAYATA